MDPINEAYQKAAKPEQIDEGKLDFQKVFGKPFKMKIGDTLFNRYEGSEPGEKVWYYTNYDYTIMDMWVEAKRQGDNTRLTVMVKVKWQNHGNKGTDVMTLKEFESWINLPNG